MPGRGPEPRPQRFPRPLSDDARPVLLAFVSAFVDVVCYLALFRTFVALISGSIVILCAEVLHQTDETLPHSDSSILIKLVVVPSFLLCLVAWVLVIRPLLGRPWLRPLLLATEAALLAALALTGWLFGPLDDPKDSETLILALIAVLAMSLQNAIMTLVLRDSSPTSVSTSNLTRFAAGLIDVLRMASPGAQTGLSGRLSAGGVTSKGEFLQFLAILLVYAFGAAAGAVGYAELGFPALALPAIVVLGAAALPGRTAGRR